MKCPTCNQELEGYGKLPFEVTEVKCDGDLLLGVRKEVYVCRNKKCTKYNLLTAGEWMKNTQ